MEALVHKGHLVQQEGLVELVQLDLLDLQDLQDVWVPPAQLEQQDQLGGKEILDLQVLVPSAFTIE